MSFRVLNTRQEPSNNINKTDSTSVYAAPRNEGAGSRENSVEAVSKVAVQKMPVSIFIYFHYELSSEHYLCDVDGFQY